MLTALGAVWALSSPLLASPDEAAHITKAAAVARGQLGGPEEVVHQSDEHVQNIIRTTVEVPAGFAGLLDDHECYAFYPDSPADCAPAISTDTTTTAGITYIGRYPPLYYAVVGWPSLVLGPPRAMLAMRLVSATVAAAFLALGLAVIAAGDRRRVWSIGAALSITPMTMFLAASVNPSALEIACGFALWCCSLDLFDRGAPLGRAAIVRVAACAVVLIPLRPLAPLYAAIIMGVAWCAAGSRERFEELRGDRTARRAAGVLTVVAVVAVAWIVLTHALDTFAGNPVVGQSAIERARSSLDEYVYRTRQMVGVFGWLDTPLNPAVIAVWIAGVATLTVAALLAAVNRVRVALVGLAAVLVVLPTAAEVVGSPSVGFVWQGRYSLPLAVGLPLVAAWALGDAGAGGSLRGTRVVRWLGEHAVLTSAVGIAVAVFVSATMLLSLVTMVRRYSVGISQPMLAHLAGGAWSPKLGQWPTFLLAVGACSAYGVLLAAWAGRARPSSPSGPDQASG